MAIETTLTLSEAHTQMSDTIKAVIDAAVDHEEAERSADAGTWVQSSTYAVLLHNLDAYRTAARLYDQVLASAVLRG